MAGRFILFLLFLATATMVMFILSVAANQPDYRVLIASAACLVLTALVSKIFPRREPPSSQRFRLFRSRRRSGRDDEMDENSRSG